MTRSSAGSRRRALAPARPEKTGAAPAGSTTRCTRSGCWCRRSPSSVASGFASQEPAVTASGIVLVCRSRARRRCEPGAAPASLARTRPGRRRAARPRRRPPDTPRRRRRARPRRRMSAAPSGARRALGCPPRPGMPAAPSDARRALGCPPCPRPSAPAARAVMWPAPHHETRCTACRLTEEAGRANRSVRPRGVPMGRGSTTLTPLRRQPWRRCGLR